MKITNAQFIKSAPRLEDAPDLGGLPEFVFLGRSNVGKSSLINMLLGRKGLAKTSNTPGKTRLINFFSVDDRWALVDLPGYGYAKVSKSEQKHWQKHLERFLSQRGLIRQAFLLVDARHEPKPTDLQMLEWLQHVGLTTTIVMTKADKISRSAIKPTVTKVSAALSLAPELIVPTSGIKGLGKDRLLAIISGCIAEAAGSPSRP